MNTCKTCRFWSDKIAKKADHAFYVEALCLNRESPKHGKYVSAPMSCPKHEPGKPVDED